jgi:hypothetical protein
MMEVLKFLWERRTTVFGYIQVILGYMVATQGLFGPDTIKWLLFFNGLLTAVLGHYNNRVGSDPTPPANAQKGNARINLLLIVAGIAMAACAVIPKSYSEKVASAYAAVAVANDTATIFLNSNTISKDEAVQVLTRTREAISAIDMARDMGPAAGKDRLTAALEALRAATELMCKDRVDNPNCQFLTQKVN